MSGKGLTEWIIMYMTASGYRKQVRVKAVNRGEAIKLAQAKVSDFHIYMGYKSAELYDQQRFPNRIEGDLV